MRKGGRCMIAGATGIGKTHLALAIATHIAAGRSLMGWDVQRPWKVDYLDGEMAPAQLKSRLKRWAKALPELRNTDHFRIAPVTASRGRSIDLTTREGRSVLRKSIRHDAEVVVIDNYAAFNPRGREDAEAWAPVDAFLNRLSNEGIATVLVHHCGKAKHSKFRGSSRLVSPVDTFIWLSRSDGASAGGKAKFVVRFEKTRDLSGNVQPRLVQLRCGKKTGYRLDASPVETHDSRASDIARLIAAGKTDSAVAKELGINRSTVHRHRKDIGK